MTARCSFCPAPAACLAVLTITRPPERIGERLERPACEECAAELVTWAAPRPLRDVATAAAEPFYPTGGRW